MSGGTIMADIVGKWAAGTSYGPVLTQTDLYLLHPDLEINPILAGTHNFHLVFDIVSGAAGGFLSDARDRDLQFTAKMEPATLPRVQQLIIITKQSPWCTIVKNQQGVTMNDVCEQLYKEYSDNIVTDAEFQSLPPRVQEQVKRTAMVNLNSLQGGGGWQGYYNPAMHPNRYKRVDWLRERKYFECLRRDDGYAKSRLGYAAPNILLMELGT